MSVFRSSAVEPRLGAEAFWQTYLDAHRLPVNRWLHAAGTLASLAIFVAAVATQNWWWLLLAPVAGYGPALGHALVEHNRPLTASSPLRSLVCDYRMTWLLLAGLVPRRGQRPQPGPAGEPT